MVEKGVIHAKANVEKELAGALQKDGIISCFLYYASPNTPQVKDTYLTPHSEKWCGWKGMLVASFALLNIFNNL